MSLCAMAQSQSMPFILHSKAIHVAPAPQCLLLSSQISHFCRQIGSSYLWWVWGNRTFRLYLSVVCACIGIWKDTHISLISHLSSRPCFTVASHPILPKADTTMRRSSRGGSSHTVPTQSPFVQSFYNAWWDAWKGKENASQQRRLKQCVCSMWMRQVLHYVVLSQRANLSASSTPHP